MGSGGGVVHDLSAPPPPRCSVLPSPDTNSNCEPSHTPINPEHIVTPPRLACFLRPPPVPPTPRKERAELRHLLKKIKLHLLMQVGGGGGWGLLF